MNNPLPEFLEDENGFTPIDLFWEEDVSEDPNWMRKVTYRVGQIVVEFNSLEQEIDSCILDWMNERGEDARIWAFIEQMPVSKKINALFTIYSRTFEWTDVPKSLVSDARDLKRGLLLLMYGGIFTFTRTGTARSTKWLNTKLDKYQIRFMVEFVGKQTWLNSTETSTK